MGKQIFLSYVRTDEERIEQIKLRLKVWGYEVWIDTNDLLPGHQWERAIHQAIRASRAFVPCVSKAWTDEERYVHREVEIALDLQTKERPDLLIIPLSLDKSISLPKLRTLHSVDMTSNHGFRDFFGVLGRSVPELHRAAGEALGDHFRVINVDSWLPIGDSPALEAVFDHFRSHAIDRSEQFVLRGEWDLILSLWAPIEHNEYFLLSHPLWEDKDLYLAYFQQAKIDMAVSHIHLSQHCQSLRGIEFRQHVQSAFQLISEIILLAPFNEQYPSGSDSRMPTNVSVAKNNDYRDFTFLVCRWLDWWGPVLAKLADVDEHVYNNLRTAVIARSNLLIALRES